MLEIVQSLVSTGFILQTSTHTILLVNSNTGIIKNNFTREVVKECAYNYLHSSSAFILSRLFFDSILEEYDDLEHCFESIISNIDDYKDYTLYIAHINHKQ